MSETQVQPIVKKKKKKTNILSIVAIICACMSMAASIVSMVITLRTGAAYRMELDALADSNASLESQVTDLNDRVGRAENVVTGLSGWTLTPSAWSDGKGATISFAGVPDNWQEGDQGALSVWLNGTEVRNKDCAWDGTGYTATVDLEAADGYSYYFVQTNPDGTKRQTVLTSPEDLRDDIPVYLADSLNTYASVFVDNWSEEGGKLILDSCYVYIQLPRLGVAGQPTLCREANLVLYCNGEEVSKRNILSQENPDAEVKQTYELNLDGLSFYLPTLEADDALELVLEAELSSGLTLTAPAASWYENGGELFFVVG